MAAEALKPIVVGRAAGGVKQHGVRVGNRPTGRNSGAAPVVVLKFGGSILVHERDLPWVAHEIYRWVRHGHKVVAVVSAFQGTTDKLLNKAQSFDATPDATATAALAATGELTTASLLALAADRAGLSAEVLDHARIGLRTRGEPLDSEPVGLDAGAIAAALRTRDVAIVPGFLGRDEDGRTTLLGRGGSDFTALFIAARIGAARTRLIKDVAGLFEHDPALPGAQPRVFVKVSYASALGLDGRIVQHKAVRFAREAGLAFEVGALNAEFATVVSGAASVLESWRPARTKPVTAVLLGAGTVGLGVYRVLASRPDLFEVKAVAVRDGAKAARAGVPLPLLTSDAGAAAASGADVVIEALGGVEPARGWIEAALRRGSSVVTANKAVVSRHGAALERIGREHGARLLYSASVGGAAGVLEAVGGGAFGGEVPEEIRAVVNATTSFVLDQLSRGKTLEESVRVAQVRGFAEKDASRDLSGLDAAEKLAVIARVAYGHGVEPLDPDRIDRTGIEGLDPQEVRLAAEQGRTYRLVGTLLRGGGELSATVRPERLEAGDPLASLSNEWVGIETRTASGEIRFSKGKGAGRWPTTQAVIGDVLDLVRELAAGPSAGVKEGSGHEFGAIGARDESEFERA